MDPEKKYSGTKYRIGWVLGLAGLAAPWIAQAAEDKPPNVLFIAVDDLRPELGVYGSKAQTPNLDRLAKSGLVFNRAYCNQAVCGPSRISVMTGKYQEALQERKFDIPNWRERHPEVVTLNQFFKANGYNTVGLGKIYHRWEGPDADVPNWTEYLNSGGEPYADPASITKGKAQAAASGKPFLRGPSTEAAAVDGAEEIYVDGWRAAEGSRKIKELAASDKPFFLAVGFSKPHLPFNAPKSFWDLYDKELFTMPKNKGVPPGYPDYARNARAGELRSYADIPPAKDGRDVPNPAEFPEELNQRLMHGYYACVSFTDRNIGKLLEALEACGAAENTIVVLWADHGYKLGDHASWTKHTNLEIDTRVPLLIADPKRKTARGKTDALVELVDLYPTLAELCGLKAPPHLQGKSMLPVLKNPSRAHRSYAYSSYPHEEGGREVMGHSIRNGQYRYTEWWDAQTDEVLARVATDLVADPSETTNALVNNPGLAKTFSRELKEIVQKARMTPRG